MGIRSSSPTRKERFDTLVFSSLTQRDKEAFFALLDEYFESRHGSTNGAIQTLSASHANVRAEANTPPRLPAQPLSASTNSSSAAGKPCTIPHVPPSRTTTPPIVEPVEQYKKIKEVNEEPRSGPIRVGAAQTGIGTGNNAFSTDGRAPVPVSGHISAQSPAPQASSPSSTPSIPAAVSAPPSGTSRAPAYWTNLNPYETPYFNIPESGEDKVALTRRKYAEAQKLYRERKKAQEAGLVNEAQSIKQKIAVLEAQLAYGGWQSPMVPYPQPQYGYVQTNHAEGYSLD